MVSRKADFIQARMKEDAGRYSQVAATSSYPTPAIKLKPTALPKFTGNKRDFYRWRRAMEVLQSQGEPTGSKEVKKFQLLDSLDDKITRDLRLTTYNTADNIFRALENRYGNQTAIAVEIVEELQKMPAVRSHQPRKIVVELIQAVEKALQDLSDLGYTGAIKNPLVTKSIEGKLPETLTKEWLFHVADRRNALAPENRFDSLLAFLKEQESIYEQLEQLRPEEPSRRETRMEPQDARTKSTKAGNAQAGCVVCGDGKHKRKLYFCKQFRALTVTEKKAAVMKLGACRRCLELNDDNAFCKPGFLCKNQDCQDGNTPEHHYFLCPHAETKASGAVQKRSRFGPEEDKSRRKYTQEQEEFFSKLSPDLAKQCRKCGGCRCGNCQPGGKEMTLSEEKELEVVREGLTYVKEDGHSKEPHWHARYPWLQDPASLPNNRRTVEATFLRTERQLAKEPEWKAAYTAQVHDMVNRGSAIKLSMDSVISWTGPVWYVSHLIAPNSHSVTTSVRLVWNSSQRFRGVSLNDLLIKGPDVLNQICAVLLRFRSRVHAALEDIKMMYNSVWLEDREVHLHGFLWRDTEEEELGEYAITRVNIGDKPAGCIAQPSMRETARLPPFIHLKEEQQVLQQDSYVDDILTSHNNPDHLRTITTSVEQILKAGGFELKPWVFSGQSGRKVCCEPEQTAKTVVYQTKCGTRTTRRSA